MSLLEILSELPNLKAEELAELRTRISELEENSTSPEKEQDTPPVEYPKGSWQEALARLAGSVDGLPADASQQVDHYLYGTPKR